MDFIKELEHDLEVAEDRLERYKQSGMTLKTISRQFDIVTRLRQSLSYARGLKHGKKRT